MGDILVMRRIPQLKWDDVIYDQHGPRRIVDVTLDYGRRYIEFDSGPAGWYLDVEELPVEVMS